MELESRKVGANEPCPCGSGKKYKRCCRRKDQERRTQTTRSKLSWQSLRDLRGESFVDVATGLLAQMGLSADDADAWLGLAEHAMTKGERALFAPLVEEASRRAVTAEQRFSLATFFAQMREHERAWAFLELSAEDGVLPDGVAPEVYWSFRGELAWLRERWEDGAEAFGSMLSPDASDEIWWRWLVCLGHLDRQEAFANACARAEQETKRVFWWILLANTAMVRGEKDQAQALYQTHLWQAVQETPRTPSFFGRALFEAFSHAVAIGTLSTHEQAQIYEGLRGRKAGDHESLAQLVRWGGYLGQWSAVQTDARLWLSSQVDALEAKVYLALARYLHDGEAIAWQEVIGWARKAALEDPQLWMQLLLAFAQERRLSGSSLEPGAEEDPQDALLWDCLDWLGQQQAHTEFYVLLRFLVLEHLGAYERLYNALSLHLQDEGSESAELALLWARSAMHSGHVAEAVEGLEPFWEAAARKEQRLIAGLWLAEAYLSTGDGDKTLAILEEISTSWPAESIPSGLWAMRARAFAQLHQERNAADAFLVLWRKQQLPWALEEAVRSLLRDGALEEAWAYLCEDEILAIPPAQGTRETRTNKARALPEDRLGLARLCGWTAWLRGESAQALGWFRRLPQAWLEEKGYLPRTLHAVAVCAQELEQPWEVLATCEQLESLLEQESHTSAEQAPRREGEGQRLLRELQALRRQAVVLLLEQRQGAASRERKASSSQTKPLHRELHEELEAQLRDQKQHWQRQQALLDAERLHLQTLLGALHPRAKDEDALAAQLAQQRQAFLARWDEADDAERQGLLQEHASGLQELLVGASGQAGAAALQRVWGRSSWLRLPKRSRTFLEAAEELLTLLEARREQDHGPVVLQWTRAVEELLNRRLVDPMARIASERLGLHLRRDLPTLGGRPLQRQNNAISLGSIPYLIAELWESHDLRRDTTRMMFNPQVSAGQRLLWEAYKHALQQQDVPQEIQDAIFSQLPALCQSWALLRNDVAHGGETLSRQQTQSLRELLLLNTPNLFTWLAQLPP